MTIKKKIRKESALRCRVLFCVLFIVHLLSIIDMGEVFVLKTK